LKTAAVHKPINKKSKPMLMGRATASA